MIARSALPISNEKQLSFVEAAQDQSPIDGLTHNFYRYPARFSPTFVRSAIETFTRPGDLVLDPYVGGGTSLVEAQALGRHAIGVDISELAEFVATVKTTVYTSAECDRLAAWASELSSAIDLRRPSVRLTEYAARGYYNHLNTSSRWRLRKAIEQALEHATRFPTARLELFGRCVVLRTAQWALDSRKHLPTLSEFRCRLVENANEMAASARAYSAIVSSQANRPKVSIFNRSAAGIDSDHAFGSKKKPKLIITSPPYPGVHVLYHRWQVDGRKEAPLPFMIANKLDGAGSSYYTMGDRKFPELQTYFDNIRATTKSIVALASRDTTFVQMVAFSDASWQLPRYLQVMADVGLSEVFLPVLRGTRDGRLWRSVPNRRWYSDQRGETPGSQEVVLIHRMANSRGLR